MGEFVSTELERSEFLTLRLNGKRGKREAPCPNEQQRSPLN
jgi:hypothetical protein